MKESRSFSKSRGTCSCHLFVYLSIFSVNKCLLRTVNKDFLWFKSFKVLPEKGVLRMCYKLLVDYLCVGVISIKLQSGFVVIALLHCSPVGLLQVSRASFLENTSGRLLLNKYNFIFGFWFIPFYKLYFLRNLKLQFFFKFLNNFF